ncbi:MAG: hypothetical protein JW919_02815 [Candidatus Omnitrophica bacterium]|nr:hypothetical protein [Candidatus Omnitrophota bacterium]
MKRNLIIIAVAALAGTLICSLAIAAEQGKAKSAKQAELLNIPQVVENTPSIKEMRAYPARKLSYTKDYRGELIPTQTDNCGKRP